MERPSDFCLAAFLRLPEHFFNIGENLFTKLHRVLILKHQRQNISIDELPIDLYIDTNEVDSDLLDAEMTEVYNKALSELPERCKLIFLLAREERMKHKEIAQALSITEVTVEHQMNIAIRKMLDAVSRYYNVVKRRIHLLF